MIDSLSIDNCVGGRLSWSYAGFDYLSKGLFKTSVLCDIENEIIVESKKVSMKERKMRQ